jgi:hypothetical protein
MELSLSPLSNVVGGAKSLTKAVGVAGEDPRDERLKFRGRAHGKNHSTHNLGRALRTHPLGWGA